MSAPQVDCDIAIVGGGPVGAALALALRDDASGGDHPLRIIVLEARAKVSTGADDPRPLALSHGSRLLLERLGAWRGLHPTAIQNIHVSQRGGFGRAALSAVDAGVPALGYVVDYNELFHAMTEAACRALGGDYRVRARATALHREHEFQRIDYTVDGTPASLSARLVVVADGGDIAGLAPPKIIDYAQHAFTARVSTTVPHKHVAYERFTAEGPLALLPFGEEMALVWTLPPARAQVLQDAPAQTFLAALRDAFGGRLGDFNHVTQRACYPLTLRCAAEPAIADALSVVTIGNAAQTLHPVAGQGFNLGLRDAWELAQFLRTLSLQALTNPQSLRRYRAGRRIDRMASIAATHGLVRLFANDFFPASVARGVGMTVLGCIAPLKNRVARHMIFGAHG